MLSENKLKRLIAIVIAVLGLIVIILGITLLGDRDDHSCYSNSYAYYPDLYYTDNASFGADFYTYIYDASDTIVDELNDINVSMSTVVDAQNSINKNVVSSIHATDDLIDTVSRTGGILTIAIGIAIVAYALHCAGIAFAPQEITPEPEELTQNPSVPVWLAESTEPEPEPEEPSQEEDPNAE